MIERTATCACGAIGVTARGEPARVRLCHCGACKRRTGGAFSLNATWPEDGLVVSGECRVHERFGEESGHLGARFFLPGVRDAAPLSHRATAGDGERAGRLFADPDFPPPRFEVFAELACAGSR